MKKILAGALGGAAVAVAVFGAGPASAVNEYVGQTYEKAAASISNGGGTPVIASRVGDYLPTEQCIVTGSRRGNFLDASGNSRGGQVLLSLNCNDTMTAGHPGYSVMSPQGAKAQQLKELGTTISSDYAKRTAAGKDPYCAEHYEWCQKQCTAAGNCSAEVMEYLGL